MADESEGKRRQSLGQMLGALGPGGMTAIGFEDYEHAFGEQPPEDELEGQHSVAQFAAEHNCEHKVDHAKRRVFFMKRK